MPKPEGYVDVAERIVEFREKFPKGSLSRLNPKGRLVPLEYVTVGGKEFVVYTAFAYREPDDPNPGVGTAWEPVPGPTNFTRDSEVQNAETAAWGRAMVAALAVDTKTIASEQEVRARTDERIVDPIPEEVVADWISAIEGADSWGALETLWGEAGAAGVTGDRDIQAAKDKRKDELK